MLCFAAMIPDAQTEMIQDAAGLRALCDDLHARTWFALDTEFVRETTYWARLCLIQVATEARVACIDPLVLDDLAPLFAVLDDPAVTKVLHSGSQDLEIFHQLSGRIPAPIFDTQVAAPLLGYGEQAGFARLVENIVGVELDKSQTRTDWAERPLPDAAVEYAGNDARYLVPLYQHMHAELERRGRLEWVTPEMASLTRPERYERAADDAWRRLRGVDRLPGAGRAVARALATWREETARANDVPRGHIVRDDAIVDVAKTRPKNRRQLERIRGLKGQALDRYGQHILDIVARAREETPPAASNAPAEAPLEAHEEALVDALAAIIKLRAAAEALNAQTVASRKDLARIVRGTPVAEVLPGWRAALVGSDLDDFLHGRSQLRASADGLQVLPADPSAAK